MVINMPTDQEIEESKRILLRDEAGRQPIGVQPGLGQGYAQGGVYGLE